MKIRRTIAAGTLALTTVITAGPLATAASAQTGTSSPPVAQNTNCRRIVKQVRNVTRRLGRAQNRLAFWQKVAAEMPARIEAQQATVADLQAQLAAATGDAAAALQVQLDSAAEKLAWMQAKLAASGRRVPVWTDAVARLTALQSALTDQAAAGECPLPTTTTTVPGDASTVDGSTTTVPGHDLGDDHGTDPAGTHVEDEGDDQGDDGPDSTVEDRSAADRQAEAQRKAAQRQAEAQRKAAEARQRAAAEGQKRAAEAQRRAAESQRRSRGGQSSSTSPAPTVDDRSGGSGGHGGDD